ncbi:hypothetical protein ACFL27_23040 [candidate division CSSED10-310 bacterium]|uniref:Uncharacterized protein n=1 Tax=candidate division CSSED10-310 bacterium TaxID=2855610 RepID=A0ABV6Z3Q8_UNCC1
MNKNPRHRKIIWITVIFIVSIGSLETGLRLGGYIFLHSLEEKNSTCLHDQEVYRIMCLGESMTALGSSDSYPNQLEHQLNQSSTSIHTHFRGKDAAATWDLNFLPECSGRRIIELDAHPE